MTALSLACAHVREGRACRRTRTRRPPNEKRARQCRIWLLITSTCVCWLPTRAATKQYIYSITAVPPTTSLAQLTSVRTASPSKQSDVTRSRLTGIETDIETMGGGSAEQSGHVALMSATEFDRAPATTASKMLALASISVRDAYARSLRIAAYASICRRP